MGMTLQRSYGVDMRRKENAMLSWLGKAGWLASYLNSLDRSGRTALKGQPKETSASSGTMAGISAQSAPEPGGGS